MPIAFKAVGIIREEYEARLKSTKEPQEKEIGDKDINQEVQDSPASWGGLKEFQSCPLSVRSGSVVDQRRRFWMRMLWAKFANGRMRRVRRLKCRIEKETTGTCWSSRPFPFERLLSEDREVNFATRRNV